VQRSPAFLKTAMRRRHRIIRPDLIRTASLRHASFLSFSPSQLAGPFSVQLSGSILRSSQYLSGLIRTPMLPERAPNNVLQMSSLLISSACFLCVSFDSNAHLPFLCFVLFRSDGISPQPGVESNISRLDLAPGLCFDRRRRTSRITGMAQNSDWN
jgi:hypothetical protein